MKICLPLDPLQLGEEAGCRDETGQVIGEDDGLERGGHGRFFSSCAVAFRKKETFFNF